MVRSSPNESHASNVKWSSKFTSVTTLNCDFLSSHSLLHLIKIQVSSVQVRSCPAFCTQQSCQPPQGGKWIPQVFVPLWCLRYCGQCKYAMLESRLLIWEPCTCKVLSFLKATGSQELTTLSPVASSLAPQIPVQFTAFLFIHRQ